MQKGTCLYSPATWVLHVFLESLLEIKKVEPFSLSGKFPGNQAFKAHIALFTDAEPAVRHPVPAR